MGLSTTIEEKEENLKSSSKDNIIEKTNLNKAFINYNNIVDKNIRYKFSYLDEWTLKKSKLLLEEAIKIENNDKTKYRVYKRGTIIKADFGVALGSEMSQVHFAIVLNKYDNHKNNVLTVIPLTSKKSKFNLPLGNLVINKISEKVTKEIINIGIEEEFSPSKSKDVEKVFKLKKLETVMSYYKSSIKHTYACCSLITTISKTRIFSPINEYDVIGRERCSDEIMDMIDKEVTSLFVK